MILLDTHVWVWWVQGDSRLSDAIIAALDAMPPRSVAISAITFWEVGMLSQRGNLRLPDETQHWLRTAASDPRIVVIPIGPETAMRAALFSDDYHRDPADRILMALTITGDYVLVTEDRRILSYQEISTLRPVELIGQ